MCEVVHVKSACGHVGGHKYLGDMVAKFLHRQVSLRLRQVTVQTVGVVAVGDQLVGHFLRLLFCAAEDNAVYAGAVVDHTLQCEILVVSLDHIVYVSHVFRSLVAVAGHEFHRIFHEAAGDACNLFRHRGREHQHLAVVGHMGQNLVDVVEEAHVEHLVCLVEHHCVHMAEAHLAALDQVKKPARSGHHHLHPFAECADLALDARPAVDGEHAQTVDIFREVCQIAGDLEAEFSGRRDDQSLGLCLRHIDALQQREAERCGLACAGLGQTDHVALSREKVRYHHLLNRHGVLESHLADSFQKARLDTEVGECAAVGGVREFRDIGASGIFL